MLQMQDSMLLGTSIDGRRKYKQGNKNDALTYLNEVKETLQDDKQTYDDFLNAMKDYKARRIDIAVVRNRVAPLLKGHRHLIFGFNIFLPKGYEIFPLPNDEDPRQRRPIRLDDALAFLTMIKKRFEGNDQPYHSFIDIMRSLREGSISRLVALTEVSSLFKDHSDIMVEFYKFSPTVGSRWC